MPYLRLSPLRLGLSLILSLLAFALALRTPDAAGGSTRTTAVLRPDGSCFITNDVTELRAQLEDRLRSWQRYKQRQEGNQDDGDNDKPPTLPPPPNAAPSKDSGPEPYSDAALDKLIRQMYADQRDSRLNTSNKIESIEFQTNVVRIVSLMSYTDPAEFLLSSASIWSGAGLYFDNARLEQDTNGHLRLTLSPPPERFRASFRTQWKRSGVEGQIRLVFPGKVLASAFPNTLANATWLELDANNEEALKAAGRMYETPTIFTAELAGLKLEKPLDSKKLMRATRGGSADDELPITDSGPGFLAEAQSISVFTHHFFTNGQAELKRSGQRLPNLPGVSIQAKLYAPKGRTLLGLSAVRVLQAKDDRGRALAITNDAPDAADNLINITSGGGGGSGSLQFTLRLPTPPADAESLNEVIAETIATSSGTWKETGLTNFNAASTNEIDLTPVLPGARVTFSKISRKNRQLTFQGKLVGPPTIRRIDFRVLWAENDRGNAYFNDRNFKSVGAKSVREFQGQASTYQGNSDDTTPVTVVIRFPQDLRRERVRFTLVGLDLF